MTELVSVKGNVCDEAGPDMMGKGPCLVDELRAGIGVNVSDFRIEDFSGVEVREVLAVDVVEVLVDNASFEGFKLDLLVPMTELDLIEAEDCPFELFISVGMVAPDPVGEEGCSSVALVPSVVAEKLGVLTVEEVALLSVVKVRKLGTSSEIDNSEVEAEDAKTALVDATSLAVDSDVNVSVFVRLLLDVDCAKPREKLLLLLLNIGEAEMEVEI